MNLLAVIFTFSAIFTCLKLAGMITCSWLWLFLPGLASLGVMLGMLCVAFLFV